jgi:putative oxidoreductase
MSLFRTLAYDWPDRLAAPLAPLGPLAARVVVGGAFAWSGWQKLNNLPQMIQNFREWGIPAPEIMTPLASGLEFFGGLLLLFGLFTRFAAVPLVVTMLVAIRSAKWGDVHGLVDFLSLDETAYLALFGWLAIQGPGAWSLDAVLRHWLGAREPEMAGQTPPPREA